MVILLNFRSQDWRNINQVIKKALVSRLIVFLIQILSAFLIPVHDADAFKISHFLEPRNGDQINWFAKNILLGYTRWDSQYFLSIAKDGYYSERLIVFFPLYPLLTRYLEKIIFNRVKDGFASLVISSILLNHTLFLISSILLFKLSMRIFHNSPVNSRIQKALEAVQYFCFNPASIFFSACYSESLFMTLTLAALLSLEAARPFCSAMFFGLACLTRSNGLFAVIFLVYFHFESIFKRTTAKRNQISILFSRAIFSQVFKLSLQLFVMLFPFVLHQIISRKIICSEKSAQNSEFCSSILVLPYAFIQKKYWNVGFLNYYQFKQLPNFALALPVLTTSALIVFNFFKAHKKKLIHLEWLNLMKRSQKTSRSWANERCLPYLLHLSILLTISLLFVHVQVSTRLIFSSTPIIYWAIASSESKVKKYFRLYSHVYMVVGTCLYSRFYPWT
ncbi:phosphatidylinositol glycan anchor biosynthesis class V [Brevipalpus obovatus]|uniref:phosphatidylinositol glycan anchor biosynthesis class V n=1 Tax=Brevipalpus obovatus TaxID=246614 RepID=UPI003D9F3D23